ncbi:MAG: acyltransferase [Desulfobacteraceae bacterium]|jgi:surface polysaccharide O-acyltransferase-like enzyme|nr:acyltransferase [Desulfobacteraceae bacterium]
MMIVAFADQPAEESAARDLTVVSGRKVAFDYLRAFVITLVLFVHAALAYNTFAFFNFENPIASSNPVVNAQRWIGFDLIVALNETFLMPLLFFVSGMFVWQSLEKKGAWKYFTDRLKRIGLPFVIGVLFLTPLAYYPAWLEFGPISGKDTSYGVFWLGMVRSGFGTAGPFWFLWLLLAFNYLATVLYQVAPLLGGFVRAPLKNILGRPVAFFGVLLGISIMVYPPFAILFGPLTWIGIGPFNAQVGRILLYLVYFLTGTAVGAIGIGRSVYKFDGALAKHWWGWVAVGLMFFTMFIVMIVVVTPMERTFASEIAFVVCCWAMVSGMIGFFLRFAKRRVRLCDSLSENSYGIYIVHYVFVTWFQYLVLENGLSPLMKGMVVFIGTLTLSWMSVAAIRRIPAVAKVI